MSMGERDIETCSFFKEHKQAKMIIYMRVFWLLRSRLMMTPAKQMIFVCVCSVQMYCVCAQKPDDEILGQSMLFN